MQSSERVRELIKSMSDELLVSLAEKNRQVRQDYHRAWTDMCAIVDLMDEEVRVRGLG